MGVDLREKEYALGKSFKNDLKNKDKLMLITFQNLWMICSYK